MWTEERYRQLCGGCDAVLLERPSQERVAVPWLHVVREHPVFLESYRDLWRAGEGRQQGVAVALGQLAAGTLASLGRAGNGYHFSHKTGQVDVLLVSHLVHEAHAGSSDDFYYGDLAGELASRGCSTAFFLIDHTSRAPDALARRWLGAAVPRIVPSLRLDAASELGFARRMLAEARLLRQSAGAATDAFERRIRRRAAYHALSRATARNLRLGTQVREIVSRLRPRAVVIPFEGHAWERLIMLGAREAGAAAPVVVAYQHAAIFRLQHAIRRALPRLYMPDRILTAGQVGREQLAASHGLAGIPIGVLGSPRGMGGRAPPSFTGSTADGRALRCLVLPEGIASECHLMFDFSLEAARLMPEMEFVWRLHPIIPAATLQQMRPGLRNLPPNVRWSSATLAEDAEQCGWTLYRGSTSVVDAVRFGSRPVYMEFAGELPVDPLFDVSAHRPSAATPGEFIALAKIGRSGTQENELVRSFCERFFVPFEKQSILEVLDSVAGRHQLEASI